ncbi:unnamed protein product [Cercopithifilaria johnstoni]|uniref:Uncharacterized protein n=1 Tax=Cercopithifilaria johnstoni TaxID=2874296 RepID=A0A8J2M6M8_9BILA|nr:unnamed protein product [Cercopithifilaria johnstoni]
MNILLTIFWFLLPIPASSIQCINGGEWIAHACTMDAQCEPYKIKSTDRVACLDSECCTMPCSNNGTFIGKACGTSYDCLPSTEKVACLSGVCCTVPQTCPYGGEVIGLECNNSKSCECLAPGVPVLCIQTICCAYQSPNYFYYSQLI